VTHVSMKDVSDSRAIILPLLQRLHVKNSRR
jgi:hypothetical protein